MHKKYFFFDIDGTLTDIKTGQVPLSTLQALEILKKKGHFVAIATGRAHYKSRPVMERFKLSNMVCNGGGGLVINQQLVRNKTLPYEEVLKLYHKAKDYHYGFVCAINDSDTVYSDNDLFLTQSKGRKPTQNVEMNQAFDITQYSHIYKIYLSIPKGEEEMFFKDLNIGYLRYADEFVVVQYDQKKEGILEMMDILQADIKDVVVFGDERNDLVMFDKRWTSIAMGNACSALKEIADYITSDSGKDGIMHACLHYQWIKEEDLNDLYDHI